MKKTVSGIVMEIGSKAAVIMTPEGEFIKVKKNSSLSLGEEITAPIYTTVRPAYIKYCAAAALIILMLIPFTYMRQAYATVAYVNVDINPSIEISINKYYKVNGVTPLNDDAKRILDRVSLKGLGINEALDKVIKESKALGYISNEKENNIRIALVSVDNSKTEISEENILEYVEKCVSDMEVDVSIKVQKTDEKTRIEAEKEGTSTNKYLEKKGNNKNSIETNINKAETQEKEKNNNSKSKEEKDLKSKNNNGNKQNGNFQNKNSYKPKNNNSGNQNSNKSNTNNGNSSNKKYKK